MNRLLYILLITPLLFARAQNKASDSLVAYTAFVSDDTTIYGITNKGALSAWNVKTLEKVYASADSTLHYTALAKDRNNTIYLGSTGRIDTLNRKDFSASPLIKLKKNYGVSHIFFTSQNKMYLIISGGIYNPLKNKGWSNFKNKPSGMVVKKRFLYFFRKKTNSYFTQPGYAFIDSNDRIWMGASYGEFGGVLNAFDTQQEKPLFVDYGLNFGSIYPNSIFEDADKKIYITSGLQHFMNSGEIFKIDGKKDASQIYNSSDYEDKEQMFDGIFIGPGAYNTTEHKLYFASSNGFYRASVPKDGKLTDVELLFSPQLTALRENLAIGMQMAVKEVTFLPDNRLIFRTAANGIGVYNGKEVIMLR